jgi:predicted glycoside hydrolase/deacetylase ChbG (UPF0249 family)
MLSAGMSRQLIVTADDFNLSEGVSRGILEAHQHGIVTETSVMVNLGDLQTASAMLTSAPRLATGLHLNITRGQPLASNSGVGWSVPRLAPGVAATAVRRRRAGGVSGPG